MVLAKKKIKNKIERIESCYMRIDDRKQEYSKYRKCRIRKLNKESIVKVCR